MKRICPVCGEEVTGRSDKVYCCDSCRVNQYNKRLRAEQSRPRPIDYFLVKFRDFGIFAGYKHFLKR